MRALCCLIGLSNFGKRTVIPRVKNWGKSRVTNDERFAVFTESFGHMRYDRRLGNGTKYYIPNTDIHALKVLSVVINVKYL